jgi:hypothetical protein
MCAGAPAAAEGSYRSRNGFTNTSASGTKTTNANSIGDMRSLSSFRHYPKEKIWITGAIPTYRGPAAALAQFRPAAYRNKFCRRGRKAQRLNLKSLLRGRRRGGYSSDVITTGPP